VSYLRSAGEFTGNAAGGVGIDVHGPYVTPPQLRHPAWYCQTHSRISLCAMTAAIIVVPLWAALPSSDAFNTSTFNSRVRSILRKRWANQASPHRAWRPALPVGTTSCESALVGLVASPYYRPRASRTDIVAPLRTTHSYFLLSTCPRASRTGIVAPLRTTHSYFLLFTCLAH
jgi:hypothetical protein